MPRPRIAVTMGDPAGIGPEVCLHLLNDSAIKDIVEPVVFGDACVLEKAANECGLKPPAQIVKSLADAEGPCVLDLGVISVDEYETGIINAATGRAGYRYVTETIDRALKGEVNAVPTGPLNKEALKMAGVPSPGPL